MLETSVRVVNRLGLHARAAAKLVSLARPFTSSITVSEPTGRKAANAVSILDLLSLAAVFGDELKVTADGIDESEALSAMAELFRSGFDEK